MGMPVNPAFTGLSRAMICYVIIKFYEVSYGVGKNYRRATANKRLARVF